MRGAGRHFPRASSTPSQARTTSPTSARTACLWATRGSCPTAPDTYSFLHPCITSLLPSAVSKLVCHTALGAYAQADIQAGTEQPPQRPEKHQQRYKMSQTFSTERLEQGTGDQRQQMEQPHTRRKPGTHDMHIIRRSRKERKTTLETVY